MNENNTKHLKKEFKRKTTPIHICLFCCVRGWKIKVMCLIVSHDNKMGDQKQEFVQNSPL